MTIREYLQRRAKLLALGIVGAWAVMAGQSFLVAQPSGPVAVAFLIAGALVFFGAILAVVFMLRCPRCNGNLGSLVAHFGPLRKMSSRQANFCPFCGVKLDDPMRA
jgi:hypothetical protein